MKFFNILLLSCLGFILDSCNEKIVEDTFNESQSNVNLIRFTAPDFKISSVNSRTSIDVAENGVKFSWSANDTIGIFPDEGTQVCFPMESGAGTNTASFTGGGWALKSSSEYTAYYPLRGEFYLDKKNIPLSYVGQIQTGNGTTDHLGAYDYMGANATVPEDGNVNFEFKHLGALVQLNIPIEEVCDLKYIVLQTEEGEFVTKASLDLSSTPLKVIPVEKSKQYGIALNNLTLSGDNMIATVYFMLSPVDLSGKNISVTARSDSKSYQYEFSGKDFQEGVAYAINATPSASASENDEAMILVTRANISNDFTAYLPLYGELDCYVDWGDGNTEHFKGDYKANEVTHKYSVSNPTSFDVKITGKVSQLCSNGLSTHTVTDVKQWGRLGLTSMEYAFRDNSLLKSIPNDVLGAFENVSTFYNAFSHCSSLAVIPTGLFGNCLDVTNFNSTFYGCSLLTTLPESLFDNCPNVTSFDETFSGCSLLTTLPEGLFDNCPNVISFDGTFSGCNSLTTLPEGLFDKCPNITSFNTTFYGCNLLSAIPKGLFDNCPNVISFYATFGECNLLSAIPEGLFDNCPNVIGFHATFGACASLTTVPEGLFDYNRKVRNFTDTFIYCTNLKGESPYTVIDGVKYHLYDRYKNIDAFITPNSTNGCFNNCSGLDDYDDIPSSWK